MVLAVRWSIPVARLWGTQVRLHLTFLVLLFLWSYDAWRATGDVRLALLELGSYLALFCCVLLHEFGHVLMARRFGIRTHDVILLPIGGVARMESTGKTPREELFIALAGPAVNLVIALLALLWIWAFPVAGERLHLSSVHGRFPALLLALNLGLLFFNLLPAFPMDGGRVLRAALTWRLGRAQATQIATWMGKLMAVLFAGWALWGHYHGRDQPMLLFIAMFVWLGASQEAAMVQSDPRLHGIPVRAAMTTDFKVLGPFDTLADVRTAMKSGPQRDFPVVAQEDVVGFLMREDLLPALRERDSDTLVREVMRTNFLRTTPETPLETLLRQVRASGVPFSAVPVLEGDRLTGLLTAENLVNYLTLTAAGRGRPESAS